MTIRLCDVAPRDGLQNDPTLLSPEDRAALVVRLAQAGLPAVEAASFVSPRVVPAMAGPEEVLGALPPLPDVVISGLVLNERGYERLASTGAAEVHFAFAATETFNRRNQNASVAQSLAVAATIGQRAHVDGRRFVATIGASFGCPFEGAVQSAYVQDLAERLLADGADAVMLADTIGVAVPLQVRHLVSTLTRLGASVGVHLHDTRNTGAANALAAIEAGATMLDGSVGGIGGCPFAPGATGNVATEDIVYLLHGEGIETGVDLDALVQVAHWLAQKLEHAVPGAVQRAGVFDPVASGRAAQVIHDAGLVRTARSSTTGGIFHAV